MKTKAWRVDDKFYCLGCVPEDTRLIDMNPVNDETVLEEIPLCEICSKPHYFMKFINPFSRPPRTPARS